LSTLLEHHGTKLVTLKPDSIVAAARADLNKAVRKREGRLDRFEPYAFHRVHVRAADYADELITLAIKGRELGLASGKAMTRLLYGDEELLYAALAVVEGRAAA
jgi:hypothetical protein